MCAGTSQYMYIYIYYLANEWCVLCIAGKACTRVCLSTTCRWCTPMTASLSLWRPRSARRRTPGRTASASCTAACTYVPVSSPRPTPTSSTSTPSGYVNQQPFPPEWEYLRTALNFTQHVINTIRFLYSFQSTFQRHSKQTIRDNIF